MGSLVGFEAEETGRLFLAESTSVALLKESIPESHRVSLSTEPPHVPPLGRGLHRPAVARRDAADRPGGPSGRLRRTDRPRCMLLISSTAGAATPPYFFPDKPGKGLRAHEVSEAAARPSKRFHGIPGPVARGIPGPAPYRSCPADRRAARGCPVQLHPQYGLARPGSRRAAPAARPGSPCLVLGGGVPCRGTARA